MAWASLTWERGHDVQLGAASTAQPDAWCGREGLLCTLSARTAAMAGVAPPADAGQIWGAIDDASRLHLMS
eukprot:6520465-Prymnesium_polylepis.2